MDFTITNNDSFFLAYSVLKGFVILIVCYAVLKFLLFIVKNYIIYHLAKKLADLMQQRMEKAEDPLPTNREDEKLRDEEKEREAEKVENVKMERMRKETQNDMEQEFKIMLPQATGKWQKMVLGTRQNMIVAVAQKMQASKSMNFWQTFVEVQKEQGRSSGRYK